MFSGYKPLPAIPYRLIVFEVIILFDYLPSAPLHTINLT